MSFVTEEVQVEGRSPFEALDVPRQPVESDQVLETELLFAPGSSKL